MTLDARNTYFGILRENLARLCHFGKNHQFLSVTCSVANYFDHRGGNHNKFQTQSSDSSKLPVSISNKRRPKIGGQILHNLRTIRSTELTTTITLHLRQRAAVNDPHFNQNLNFFFAVSHGNAQYIFTRLNFKQFHARNLRDLNDSITIWTLLAATSLSVGEENEAPLSSAEKPTNQQNINNINNFCPLHDQLQTRPDSFE